jgi:1-acyl-sn-glycerol-3-phosphate acyltransferase
VAERYAIDIVKRGREVLVVFPEREIYYLNDLVQPVKSGAVDIGTQAVVEMKREQPDWTAYLVPMAIQYRYRQPIRPVLEWKTRLMEQRLFRRTPAELLPRRLALIVSELVRRRELIHHLAPDPDRRAELTERVQEARRAVLSQIEEGYAGATANSQAQTMDRAWAA